MRTITRKFVIVAIALFASLRLAAAETGAAEPSAARAGPQPRRTPEGSSQQATATNPAPKDGLAALYPGDEGLERDPRVLFVEDFETGDVTKIGERWGNITSPKNIELSAEIPPNSPGTRSLHMAPNASLFTHTKGVDRLHVRFYVRFHSKTGYLHHFVGLAAERVPTPWPQPRAGQKPAGDGWFSSLIEPWGKWGDVPPPGVWHFYSNWHEMKGGPNGYWGNHFDAPQEPVEPGRWYCIEAVVQCNSVPDAADGEQAFWVDGKLIGHFKGIRWRTSDQLQLNSFWLNYYVTDSAAQANNDKDPNRAYEVWFNDIVLATEYIGPVSGRPKSGKKAAVPGQSALLTPGLLLPAPGKVVYAEQFDDGAGKFRGGEVVVGGVNDSKALAVPPNGVNVWNAFATKVQDSTTIRFKLKPPADVQEVTVMLWSAKHQDNCRYQVRGLRPGEWNAVEFRALEARTGFAMDGPGLDGEVLKNIIVLFPQGTPDARVLLDDVEVRE